jgi:hypothetical protein
MFPGGQKGASTSRDASRSRSALSLTREGGWASFDPSCRIADGASEPSGFLNPPGQAGVDVSGDKLGVPILRLRFEHYVESVLDVAVRERVVHRGSQVSGCWSFGLVHPVKRGNTQSNRGARRNGGRVGQRPAIQIGGRGR